MPMTPKKRVQFLFIISWWRCAQKNVTWCSYIDRNDGCAWNFEGWSNQYEVTDFGIFESYYKLACNMPELVHVVLISLGFI